MKRVQGKKFEFPVYYDVEEPSVLETNNLVLHLLILGNSLYELQ